MIKQNQVTEAKPNQKSCHEAKRALVNELADELSSLVKLPARPFSIDSDGSIEAHATQLGDVRLQDAQRQALAVQIGRVNGNRHLQRVVASLKRNEVGTAYAAPSGTDNTIETTEGETLLDHELTHVVQQTKNSGPLDASPSLEGEARQAGLDAISGRPVRVSGSAPYGQPQRDVSDWMAEQLYRWDPLRLRTYTVESVLRENDPSKVSQLRRDQIARASVEDRLRLVRLALRALDRESVETIWGTFSRQQLIEVTSASRNMQLWRRCLREGADLDELRPVQELQRDFQRGVKAIAGYYLRQNRDYVVGQMGSLGIPDPTRQRMVRTGLLPIAAPLAYPSAATITAEQAGELQRVQELAVKVHEAQQAQEALRRIPVGYDDVETGCRTYGEVWTRREAVTFNPNRRPHHSPRGTEDPRMASWDEVKRMHDQVQALISGIANRCPAIYALIRDERVGDLAQAGDQAEARRVVGATLASLLNNIDETQRKLDSDRLDYRELRPIHAQMFGGRGTRPPGTIETNWTQPLPRWVGEEDVRAHERAEFWLSLGLGSLAAAAFVIAELATFGGATFFVAAGVGLGLSGTQAARSWAGPGCRNQRQRRVGPGVPGAGLGRIARCHSGYRLCLRGRLWSWARRPDGHAGCTSRRRGACQGSGTGGDTRDHRRDSGRG
jgi:hypothetical protein